MSDGIRLAPCVNCNASGWMADGMGDWIRCSECNPEPPPKHQAKVLTFARGARVRKPEPPNDWPPEAA